MNRITQSSAPRRRHRRDDDGEQHHDAQEDAARLLDNVSAGRVNARVQAHNFTTGYDEAWSVRLFLSDHEREVAMRKTHLSTGPFAVWHEPLTRQRVVGVLYRHGFDRDGAIRIADAAALHYRHKFLVTDSAGDVVYIAEVKE